jgi:hypothetical protein
VRYIYEHGINWPSQDSVVLWFLIHYLELNPFFPKIVEFPEDYTQGDPADEQGWNNAMEHVSDSCNILALMHIFLTMLANMRFNPVPPSMNTLLMLNPPICASTTKAACPSLGIDIG